MSFKDKPIIKLYGYTNNAFKLVAVIDDYEELSMEHNIYSAGSFSVQINYNIPNSQLFRKNMFLQLGDNADDFFVIMDISDNVGESGKASQVRTITGYDARYIFKRRIINNLNNGSKWEMTGKAESVMIALLNDHCGNNAETKRKLPVIIPISQNRGADFTASESYSNLYDALENIATQSELGWKIEFINNQMQLVFYTGTDRTKNVKFSTDMDSLRNGNFTDSLDSFTNAVYVGGKGNNDSKDIYLGESGIDGNAPSGLDRFEIWDNQSSMTSDEEYENEAFAKLSQYGQTVNVSGQGMIKCPYEFREQYFIGDIINLSFSGKSANVRILSITEHWGWGSYETEFSFGKPIVDLGKQLQLILKKLQSAENEIQSNSTDSVRYYEIPDELVMPKGDVNYRTIGFIGNIGNSNRTFQLYFDANGTGAKTYHVYFKQLEGSGKLILSTGVAGKSNLEFNSGTYVAIIYVDEEGNVKVGASLSDVTTSTTSSWSGKKTQTELGKKLSTSGGAMTGNISYQGSKATYQMIKWIDNTADADGNGVCIGGGGAVVIGSGESQNLAVQNDISSGGNEKTLITGDQEVKIYSHLQNGWDGRKEFVFDNVGNIILKNEYSTTIANQKHVDTKVDNGQGTVYPRADCISWSWNIPGRPSVTIQNITSGFTAELRSAVRRGNILFVKIGIKTSNIITNYSTQDIKITIPSNCSFNRDIDAIGVGYYGASQAIGWYNGDYKGNDSEHSSGIRVRWQCNGAQIPANAGIEITLPIPLSLYPISA